MKKILLPTIALTLLFSTTSCKKDWTCECSAGMFSGEDFNLEITKEKEKDAEALCTEHESESNDLLNQGLSLFEDNPEIADEFLGESGFSPSLLQGLLGTTEVSCKLVPKE